MPTRALPPELLRSTPMPGVKWSRMLFVGSIGTRATGPHVVSLVDLDSTTSLAGQPDRNRQSDQVTYAVPAESISAEGSASSRSPPAASWWLTAETRTVDRQLPPPSIQRNERTWPDVD